MSGPSPNVNATLRAIFPWAAATAIVLAAAVTAGFLVAYLVASGRGGDGGTGLTSPTARPTPGLSHAPGMSDEPSTGPTGQPRRTPTPVPVPTTEASPIAHVVQRGEYLSYIAALYCTTTDEIVALNGITNPDVIQPGDTLLIPGGGCASPLPSPV